MNNTESLSVLIRRLKSSDQTFLNEALYNAIYVPPGETPPSRTILTLPNIACYVSDWMQHADDLGVLAEAKSVPVGAAWLRCWTGRQRGYGFVDSTIPELSMSVLPPYRGRGVGTKMLRRLLSAAKERHSAVSLSVSTSNPARRLYEREGFTARGLSKDGSITMVKVFSQESEE